MPSLDTWLGGTSAIDASQRAVDAWGRIQRNPVSIALARGNSDIPAQTMRLEFDNRGSELEPVTDAQVASRPVTLFGIQNHPTEDDTDIKRDDRFFIANHKTIYRVLDIIYPPGEIQARCEAVR